MTALAMIMGMMPMALGLGEAGEQNAPLGPRGDRRADGGHHRHLVHRADRLHAAAPQAAQPAQPGLALRRRGGGRPSPADARAPCTGQTTGKQVIMANGGRSRALRLSVVGLVVLAVAGAAVFRSGISRTAARRDARGAGAKSPAARSVQVVPVTARARRSASSHCSAIRRPIRPRRSTRRSAGYVKSIPVDRGDTCQGRPDGGRGAVAGDRPAIRQRRGRPGEQAEEMPAGDAT